MTDPGLSRKCMQLTYANMQTSDDDGSDNGDSLDLAFEGILYF